ncbi:cell wall metabolism sensor histidine kinase WalK [Paenibacillus sp. OV219]|uniref:sensor histidine kinase n=1 Tax=Paenibacillus sp. OV219 TaxID=1884377 RepID=UPI0008BEBFAB|nr:HAMP domain-containing sensor histidine kinase [Paenibacillus sp. OV219]SEO39782.1 two-component system, OmpR family, sensor histidine kinase VanS [Paenibacillus sp. OV219]
MTRRKGIRFKIFLVTTALLVMFALVIYLTLYFMLPSYYKLIKQDRLESGVSELVKGIDGKSTTDAIPLMAQFGQEHNAMMMLRDSDGNGYYIPPNFRTMKNWIGTGDSYLGLRKQMQAGRFEAGSRDPSDRGMHLLSVERKIKFAESDEVFTLYVDAPLQPVGEAAGVILLFLPYMLIPILLIAIGGALIYSRLIAKPLLSLNKVARRLAKLDFSATEPALKTRDELGELSLSLSRLAVNLQSTMGELQEANTQLKSDIEREREQESKRREFVATISHELKTPITAVSGQLEAMIANVGAFRDRDTYLRKSYTIMQDMDKLVHEILELSKLESRDFLPLMREVDLVELIRESVGHVSYLANVKNMTLDCELPDEAIITADERLMSKAVSNIITNAVQYSGDEERVIVRLWEEPVSISADGVRPRMMYRLEVLNTGVAIDEPKLPRLFEPFYRAEQSRSRSTGGSGLGLYIVSKVLDAHGAQYSITNTPEGVRFSVLLQGAA